MELHKEISTVILLVYLITLTGAKMAHPCERECVPDAPPMTCLYTFKLESYQSLSKSCYRCADGNYTDCLRPDCIPVDGIARPLTVVNRQLPGPGVRVCLGDRVVVDVENALTSETTSLHWHGHHQRGSPHMDGVPHVTQCPIQPGSVFRYVFIADNPGTHFWHSHSGLQRADGVYGSLVIRQGPKDPHRGLYDTDAIEHEVHVTDWLHGPAHSKFVMHHHGDGNNKPRSILINGQGRFGNVTYKTNNFSVPIVPTATFNVKTGLRHRFRLINSGFLNCPLQLSIDNHTLLVIASDGSDLRPIEVDSLVSYAGERYDFIVNANQPVARYWMRVRGLMDCDERFHSVHQVAIIAYDGSKQEEPSADLSYDLAARGGKQLNPLNVGTNDGVDDTVTIAEALSLVPGDLNLLSAKPDHVFYIGYDFYKKDNPIFHKPGLYGFHQVALNTERLQTPQLNHISLKLPAKPVIMQDEASLASEFCNQTSLIRNGKDCKNEFCRCLHRIRVEVGDVIDLVLVDEGVAFNANHPFHLHGHAFHVMAMYRFGDNTSVAEVRQLLQQGLLPRHSVHAPLKDTITVPDGGFTLLRLRASNPGVWLFHCHIGFHVEVGMGFVFQVGDWSSFAKAPSGFPTCGNWLPSLDSLSKSQEPEITLLNATSAVGERVLYQFFNNVSHKSSQIPPVVIVQHTWSKDSWWPVKPTKNASSRIDPLFMHILPILMLTFHISFC